MAVEVLACKARAVVCRTPGRRGKRCKHAKLSSAHGEGCAWSSCELSPLKAKQSQDLSSSLSSTHLHAPKHSTGPAHASKPQVSRITRPRTAKLMCWWRAAQRCKAQHRAASTVPLRPAALSGLRCCLADDHAARCSHQRQCALCTLPVQPPCPETWCGSRPAGGNRARALRAGASRALALWSFTRFAMRKTRRTSSMARRLAGARSR